VSSSPRRPARLFLDANVLVSAAWKDASKVLRLWQIPNVELVTSNFAVEECQRNLPLLEQHERLARLLLATRVLSFHRPPILQNAPPLAPKGQHVLAAAVLARASFLVTGDRTHFGAWYGSRILGVRVEPPASFPAVLEEI
jgi:predicted nucleic acid-binding protein